MSAVTLRTVDRVVLGAAALWQFVAWGGRISLLTDAETSDWWNWTRIGGSLVVGVGVLLVGIGLVNRSGAARVLAWAYLVLGVVTWGRSLAAVWTEPNTIGFRLVHTVLALVTWGLGVACVLVVRRSTDPARVAAGD